MDRPFCVCTIHGKIPTERYCTKMNCNFCHVSARLISSARSVLRQRGFFWGSSEIVLFPSSINKSRKGQGNGNNWASVPWRFLKPFVKNISSIFHKPQGSQPSLRTTGQPSNPMLHLIPSLNLQALPTISPTLLPTSPSLGSFLIPLSETRQTRPPDLMICYSWL